MDNSAEIAVANRLRNIIKIAVYALSKKKNFELSDIKSFLCQRYELDKDRNWADVQNTITAMMKDGSLKKNKNGNYTVTSKKKTKKETQEEGNKRQTSRSRTRTVVEYTYRAPVVYNYNLPAQSFHTNVRETVTGQSDTIMNDMRNFADVALYAPDEIPTGRRYLIYEAMNDSD